MDRFGHQWQQPGFAQTFTTKNNVYPVSQMQHRMPANTRVPETTLRPTGLLGMQTVHHALADAQFQRDMQVLRRAAFEEAEFRTPLAPAPGRIAGGNQYDNAGMYGQPSPTLMRRVHNWRAGDGNCGGGDGGNMGNGNVNGNDRGNNDGGGRMGVHNVPLVVHPGQMQQLNGVLAPRAQIQQQQQQQQQQHEPALVYQHQFQNQFQQQHRAPLTRQPALPHGLASFRPPELLHTTYSTYEILHSLDLRSDNGQAPSMSVGVYLVKDIVTAQLFVQKRLDMTTSHNRERALTEINALLQVSKAGTSPHINLLLEHFWDGHSPFCSLILEHCDVGTLDDLISRYIREHKTVPEAFAWHVLDALSAAVNLLHNGTSSDENKWNVICHLDIKPGNVFLTLREPRHNRFPRVVLGDFGCVTTAHDIATNKADKLLMTRGTPGWFPPENKWVREKGPHWEGRYGKMTDMWQVGGIVQALCRLIFAPDMEMVDRGWPCGHAYSVRLNGLIGRLLHRNSRLRPQAVDLVEEVRDVVRL